jgi:hypothetical protein
LYFLYVQQIQHPTAALIARTATAQDDITGDGTTSNVLLIGELLRQASRFLSDGLHPRVVSEGFDLAKEEALRTLETFKVKKDVLDAELLRSVARTSLRTKLQGPIADQVRCPISVIFPRLQTSQFSFAKNVDFASLMRSRRWPTCAWRPCSPSAVRASPSTCTWSRS